ncbi:TonB-dependent receptor plug domain-containing protein [Agriterribacter sp.]|uniref:TonB-dependent receptor plug domain-containing protein n=1 Tax=Agriterribacter sp. TaxID=2821509 RepID=UPI002D025FE6|nr:TonB-dependent receptor plug domain-containing protein [Agriterribacter sp.]HRO46835.1 TonB-dependent receptor plug domain-containing protein [Agriterribacter sp.]HRQ18048.1 TonB-dependent receptor plug domain-containing protein [Agriterribacter sp.]
MRLIPKPGGKVLLFLLISIGAAMSVLAQDSLRVDSMILSNRSGLENILQGNIAGLRVKNWSGTPGVQSTLNLRGLSLDPTDQSTMPLILINGIPVIASPSNVTGINPLSYFSPEQVDRIEIIKDIDRLAAYGVQAPNGALNIIMKEGQPGSIHVRGSAFAGVNFLQNMDYRKDAFYNFNTRGRREVYGSGAMIHEQNVMVDGAGTYGSYLFGLTNHGDKGIIKNTGFGRQSLFLNATYNITERLSAHFYNNLALANRNGRYAGEYSRDITLPVIADESFFMDKNRNIGLVSSMGLTYQLGSGFKISSVAGLSYEGASRDVYIPSDVLDGNIYASSAAYKRQLITVNTSLNYLRDFSDALQLDMTLGNELRNTDDRLTSVSGQRSMENGGSNYVKVVTGYNANQTDALSDHEKEKLLSFYGIWKWKYKKDLGVNMVLRADGSSLYKNKWAFYPALGVHYELKNSLKIPVTVNASIGRTGVLSRPEVYRGVLDAYGDYYGGNYLGVGQLYPAFGGAKSIGVTQIDAGLSFAILPSLNLSVDYFNKTYRNFTYQRFLPNISGIGYEYETGGALGLSGVEISLDATWVQTKHFTWTGNLNMALYKNKVKELPDDVENTSLAYLGSLSKGTAVTSLIAWEGKQPKVIGNSEPKAFGGLSNTFRYRNISASIILTYAWGANIVAESFSSRYYADRVGNDFPLKSAETPYYLVSADADGRTVYQGIRTVEDGSFLRLSRASVSWHLNSVFKKLAQLSDIEVFARGDNLLTLSKYSGINPEENITGVRRYDLSYTGTPLPSSVALGLKLVF